MSKVPSLDFYDDIDPKKIARFLAAAEKQIAYCIKASFKYNRMFVEYFRVFDPSFLLLRSFSLYIYIYILQFYAV